MTLWAIITKMCPSNSNTKYAVWLLTNMYSFINSSLSPLESVDEYKNVVFPRLNFQKGNSQYEILNHVYFGPNFTFGDFFFCRRPTMVVKSFTQRSLPLTIKKLPTALLMHSHWTKFATLNALTCYCASFWSHLCIFLTHVSYFLIWNLSKNIFEAVQ